ncbi:hypothetical protein CDAR_63091 [Caerostris darwini]|uniref:Uncharacterized protein n=1 Tax=Caerostris darwini TaxID=1538125 RepID=A0AAV4UFE4_9ARAC|nr:hypothetical protein CDAR_63091 [Caerostris darwini]
MLIRSTDSGTCRISTVLPHGFSKRRQQSRRIERFPFRTHPPRNARSPRFETRPLTRQSGSPGERKRKKLVLNPFPEKRGQRERRRKGEHQKQQQQQNSSVLQLQNNQSACEPLFAMDI